MNIQRIFRLYALLTLLALSSLARADDTDLFLVNPAVAASRPNVLIILDNTANWNTAFAWEKSSLQTVVNGLDDRFNVGLMMFTETGAGNTGVDGGYIRYAVRQMIAANKTNLANMVNGLDSVTDKSNSGKAGLAMYEANQYFAGDPSYAGGPAGNASNGKAKSDAGAFSANATYGSPISDDCQKNFIIYISNGPVQDNAADTATASSFLNTLGGNITTIPLNPNGSESGMSDEYARYFSSHNVDTRAAASTRNIVTYTVDVLPGATGQGPGWTAMLKSMALQGKGKYFVATDASTIVAALNKIFQEVQAVNSVYASSTLPVSVNVRGTYLNQVYMGVFRPDANSSPRWTGNLKQYTIARDAATDSLFLADKSGVGIENAASGFVSPTISSFWTTTSTFWDATYYPGAQGSGATSDAPDGDLVEKGGAAQHLRTAYAHSQAARNVYTCIDTCTGGSALSGFPFNTGNSAITSTLLGLNSKTVSLAHTVGTSIVTATAASHGFNTGDTVGIAGATASEYNGSFVITKVDNNTFTYAIVESPVTPATATGQITASLESATSKSVNITRAGSIATATTSDAAAHGYSNGQLTAISGCGGFNGSPTIATAGPGSNTFTFAVTESPPASVAGGNATLTGNTSAFSISTLARSGSTVTVTPSGCNTNTGASCFPNTFVVGATAIIAGTGNSAYDGQGFTIATTSTGSKTTGQGTTTWVNSFTFTVTVTPPASASNCTATPAGAEITSIARSGTTATATSVAHPFTTGNSVCVAGTGQSQYNVCAAITKIDANTFTYPVTVSPNAGSSATATIAGGISRNDLINWVRGQNTRSEDNPSGLTTDVRGYLHGDVLHSRPAVINYNRTSQPANRDIVVFYGANDGVFHAAKGGQNDADGDEKWSFIPTELFDKLPRLYSADPAISAANPKPYFIDGPISAYQYDANSDGQYIAADDDLVYLYLGMRRGGRFVYALDVSDPDAPKYLWKKGNTDLGFGELGTTWSELRVATINANSNPVLIFGAGYDAAANDADPATAATMGRGIFIIDAITGALIWEAGPGAAPALPAGATFLTVSGMNYSIAADMSVIDSDSDGTADRIYAADTGGNIWRVNIDDADPNNWTVTKIAALGGSGADGRKFLYRPDVVNAGGYDAVLIGSGDREHPFDTTVQNRFYMIKDDHALNATMSTITDNNASHTVLCNADAADLSTCLAEATNKGWYLSLGSGEKTVGGAVTLAGTVFFGTNLPVSAAAVGSCTSTLGEARLYAISYVDASATLDQNQSGSVTVGDRFKVRPGGGYPPSPVPVVVEIDGRQYETVISGTQLQTPRTPPRGQRFRTYWHMLLE